jgi:hypothetical protein
MPQPSEQIRQSTQLRNEASGMFIAAPDIAAV